MSGYRGQITTADFYFRVKVRNVWKNAPVITGVVVTIDNEGGLANPEDAKRRALRHIVAGDFEANYRKFELVKFQCSGLDLGKTAYKIDKPARSRPWEL